MLRNSVELRHEAFVFWSAVSDFRRDLRNGIPVSYITFAADIDVIHEMSDHLPIKMRCVDVLCEMNGRLHQGLLA